MSVKHVLGALIASAGLSLAPLAPSAEAAGMVQQESDNQDFTVYWAVCMFAELADPSWQSNVNFGGAAVSRDLIFLTQFKVGAFPRPGIHMFELHPEMWDAHWRKLARDMDRYVPEDFTGIVVIDYERWRPYWERTRNIRNDDGPVHAEDFDFLLDWRDAVRETRRDEYFAVPAAERLQYVYDTYDEMALRFYIETIRECKRLRPNARWTYFNFPKLRYYCPEETPRGTIGYGDLTHRASRINDKCQALYDEMDVVVPSIYPQQWTVAGNNFRSDMPLNRQNRDRGNYQFIFSNVAEARRLAHGKPVLPIISLRYYMQWPERLWLNDLNIRQAISVSQEAGAEGLILWEGIGTRSEWNALQAMVSERLAPAIRDLVGGSSGGAGDAGDVANSGAGKSSGGGNDQVISGVLSVGGE